MSLPLPNHRFTQLQTYLDKTAAQQHLASCTTDEYGMRMSSPGNQVWLLKNAGPTYERLFQEFSTATKNINIEVFSWRDDQAGREFRDALIKKARDGVKIKVLADGWGVSQNSIVIFLVSLAPQELKSPFSTRFRKPSCREEWIIACTVK